jgi:hypothetical protein
MLARQAGADHPAPGGGRDDLRRNPGAAAAAACLPLPGGEPDVVAADRLVARLFGARRVHPRLQTVERDNALARENAPSAASVSRARRCAVRPAQGWSRPGHRCPIFPAPVTLTRLAAIIVEASHQPLRLRLVRDQYPQRADRFHRWRWQPMHPYLPFAITVVNGSVGW